MVSPLPVHTATEAGECSNEELNSNWPTSVLMVTEPLSLVSHLTGVLVCMQHNTKVAVKPLRTLLVIIASPDLKGIKKGGSC